MPELITQKILQKGIKRFGTELVLETCSRIARIIEREPEVGLKEILTDQSFFNTRSSRSSGRMTKDPNEFLPVARFLLQDSQENQDLLSELIAKINGVSEPATVPHQTPEARVTPRLEGRDGDKEKHQLS